jgi:hypothetical protein
LRNPAKTENRRHASALLAACKESTGPQANRKQDLRLGSTQQNRPEEKLCADRRSASENKIGTGRLEHLTAGGKGETGSARTLQAEQKNSDRDWAAPSVARGENGRKETGAET